MFHFLHITFKRETSGKSFGKSSEPLLFLEYLLVQIVMEIFAQSQSKPVVREGWVTQAVQILKSIDLQHVNSEYIFFVSAFLQTNTSCKPNYK